MKRDPAFPILSFWRRFTLRHAAREWVQSVLMLVILALGVGTFLSIRMANRSAVQGFQLFTESLRGPSDWIVEPLGSGIPLEELAEIRHALNPLPAILFPVFETSLSPVADPASLDAAAARQVRLLGLDLVQIRSTTEASGFAAGEPFWDLLADPEHLLVSRSVAELWQVQPGDTVKRVIKVGVLNSPSAGCCPNSAMASRCQKNWPSPTWVPSPEGSV